MLPSVWDAECVPEMKKRETICLCVPPPPDSTWSLNTISGAAAHHKAVGNLTSGDLTIHTSIKRIDQCCLLTTLTNSISSECVKWWPVVSRTRIISSCPSRVHLCQDMVMPQLVTSCANACVGQCVKGEVGRKEGKYTHVLHVYMWWDVSLSIKGAPQSWFSSKCQKGQKPHTHTHTYSQLDALCCLFYHTEALKCVSEC